MSRSWVFYSRLAFIDGLHFPPPPLPLVITHVARSKSAWAGYPELDLDLATPMWIHKYLWKLKIS